MPSVCFYFQVHQPFRLKRYSHFDIGNSHQYFDEENNRRIMEKVASKCYLPTDNTILNLIKRYGKDFKVSYSITGVAIEQMQRYSPETIESFMRLADTGCVEFLGETYYHSLSAVYDPAEFEEQVKAHSELMNDLFGITPKVFRNTELIYENRIGQMVEKLGFNGMIAEGVDDVLGWRSPNYLYTAAGTKMPLLLKNYRLSDDIAFRFSNRGWGEFPLTSDKFANWVHQISGSGETVNLFMDYETFGEHQWADSGIFQFLEHLPEAILRHPDWNFKTPSEVVSAYKPVAELPFHRLTSWADVDRDLTAWRGNNMQHSALNQAYEFAYQLKQADPFVQDIWRRLQTSDHFYYMCTKWFADGDVHAYFSPYQSPYDAFINYMNVMQDFRKYYLDGESVAHCGLSTQKVEISRSQLEVETIIEPNLEELFDTTDLQRELEYDGQIKLPF